MSRFRFRRFVNSLARLCLAVRRVTDWKVLHRSSESRFWTQSSKLWNLLSVACQEIAESGSTRSSVP